MSKTPPVVLSIAGSDSAGASGIQADLRTFAALRVHGATALTAVTAQNTLDVQAVHLLSSEIVHGQVLSILADLPVRSTKTGVLGNAEIINLVASLAAQGDLGFLVVDPVANSTTGKALAAPGSLRAYREELFAHTDLLTPNISEAEWLTGRNIDSQKDIERAARDLAELGPRWVVIKGGHLKGQDCSDLVWDGSTVRFLHAPRVPTTNLRGTGCTFSAALTAYKALGMQTWEALQASKLFTQGAIQGAVEWHLGAGDGPLNHLDLSRFRWEPSADRNE